MAYGMLLFESSVVMSMHCPGLNIHGYFYVNRTTVFPGYPQGIGSRTPCGYQILGFLKSLIKTGQGQRIQSALCIRSSVSVGFRGWLNP